MPACVHSYLIATRTRRFGRWRLFVLAWRALVRR
jgi:hypothetical protein